MIQLLGVITNERLKFWKNDKVLQQVNISGDTTGAPKKKKRKRNFQNNLNRVHLKQKEPI